MSGDVSTRQCHHGQLTMTRTKRRRLFPVFNRERLDNMPSLGFNVVSPGHVAHPLASLGVLLAERARGLSMGAQASSWARSPDWTLRGLSQWVGRTRRRRDSATCAPATSAPGSRSSGPRRNHHWISRYTEEEPLWKAQDISTFCPSVAVTFRGNSVNFAAKQKRTLLEYTHHS